jgi:hypothetical protein
MTYCNKIDSSFAGFIACCVIFYLCRKMDVKLNKVFTQTSNDDNTARQTSVLYVRARV